MVLYGGVIDLTTVRHTIHHYAVREQAIIKLGEHAACKKCCWYPYSLGTTSCHLAERRAAELMRP